MANGPLTPTASDAKLEYAAVVSGLDEPQKRKRLDVDLSRLHISGCRPGALRFVRATTVSAAEQTCDFEGPFVHIINGGGKESTSRCAQSV